MAAIGKLWRRSFPFVRIAIATLPVLAITIYLFLESRGAERALLEAETAREADNAFLQFQGYLATRISVLNSVGFFVLTEQDEQKDFSPFVSRLTARFPDFTAVARMDIQGHVVQRYPAAGAGAPDKPEAPGLAAAREKAAASRHPAAAGSFEIAPGDQGLTIIVPLYRDQQFAGSVAGTIRLTQAMNSLYARDAFDWNMEIEDRDGRNAYRSVTPAKAASPLTRALVTERFVPVADQAWKLRLWPTPLLVDTLRTTAPQRILGIGLFASLILATANLLLAQRQARLAESLRESKRLAAAVDTTRRQLSDLVNGIEAVIWESDAEMRHFTFVNDYARKLLGIDTSRWVAEPAFWFENVHPDDRARACENSRAARRPGHTYPAEYRMIDTSGRVLWVREIITVMGAGAEVSGKRGVVVDITARVEAEEAFRQSQKLESLGVLAGGIAHDFNNLLTTILGNAEMLGPFLGGKETPGAVHLEKIERTTRRLAELTRQMLAYSGRGKFSVDQVDLNAVITEMAGLLAVSTPKNVRVTYQLDAELPTMEADPVQMRQVVLNLLTNAAEAIGETARGEVVIRTSECVIDKAASADLYAGQDVEPGRYVRLEVSDNGCGMSPETISKIFDPFFTTKFAGRGLGLAALRGIVRGHRGGIRISSRADEGTVFTLIFPARGERPRLSDAQLPSETAGSGLEGATALVIDDEEGLRSLMAAALADAGCTVIEAADGDEGLEQFRRHTDEIDIVVLDVTMPRLGGEEVFKRIQAARPGTPVILCSGYTKEDVARQFSGDGLAGFLEKPFAPSELIEKIRNVLDSQADSAPAPAAGELLAQIGKPALILGHDTPLDKS